MAFKQTMVEPLNGDNYATWKLQCQMALMKDGLWTMVDGTEVEPADLPLRVKFREKRNKALATIVLTIATKLHYLLGTPTDPRVVWTTLEEQFQKKSWPNVLELRRKLHLIKLEEGGSVQGHIKELTEILDELSIVDEPVKKKDRVLYLLASLPDPYSMLVTALEASVEVPEMALVTERLLHEERKLKSRSTEKEGKEEEALASRDTRGGPRCHGCGKLGHIRRVCPEARRRSPPPYRDEGRRSPPRDKRSVSFRPAEYKPRGAYRAAADWSEDEEEDGGTGLLTTQPTGKSDHDLWIMDSGASSHMCKNVHQFRKLNTLKRPLKVTLGDGHPLKATGRGDVTLMMNMADGKSRCTLHDVLYVPNLTVNLFSVSKAAQAGKRTEFTKDGCHVRGKGDQLIARGYQDRNLYYLDQGREQHHMYTASVSTWHRRFGHLGEQSLKKVENMVLGLKVEGAATKSDVCVPCLSGKQHCTPFQEGTRKTKRPLELVHSDVCGQVGEKSLGGAEYFVTFIDDWSNHIWTFPIKKKSEVFATFKRWKARVENETGKKLQTLRTDNGGEYTSGEFRQHLDDCGIRHERSVPKTPEQNGKAERLNRTLLESVRSMLADSGLAKKFWAEAMATAVFLRNRSPTKTLQDVTPAEAWSGRKPDVSLLKVFGCRAYAHVPRSERGKLDPKTRNCWMMGYGDSTKGYRLYDRSRERVFFSRNVSFDERREDVQEEQDESGGDDAEEEEKDTNPQPRRSERSRRSPDCYGEWSNLAAEDPSTLVEAMRAPETEEWQKAMDGELESLELNKVWTLVDLPKGKRVVGSRWVFKRKPGMGENEDRFKARLVARGFTQRGGVDYEETFSPVVRSESVKAMLAKATQENMHLHQMDVTTAFLNGELDEEVYMKQPEGREVKGKEDKVCKLHKSIYGLKQAPRCWNHVLDGYLRQMGFSQASGDPCLYLSSDEDRVMIAVYVDDLVLAGNELQLITSAKRQLSTRFKMKDLGELHYFLGIEVVQDRRDGWTWIGQTEYATKLLERFGMQDSKPVKTPSDTGGRLTKRGAGEQTVDGEKYQAAVGSLLYLSTRTRPDMAFAVGIVARFCSGPTQEHWTALKRILRYLRGTHNFGLFYQRREIGSPCVGYSDADWGGSIDDRKSTSGYVFQWNKSTITWRSCKQTCVALSTAEAEYVALAAATQEALWIKELIGNLDGKKTGEMLIFEDNKSAICMATNPVFHAKTKHIDLKFHFIRDHVTQGNIVLEYCPTEDMVADVFTKSLPAPQFERLREMLGVRKKTDC